MCTEISNLNLKLYIRYSCFFFYLFSVQMLIKMLAYWVNYNGNISR